MYDKVFALARKKGVSIAQVERDLGFSNASLRKMSTNNPSSEKVVALAHYFGVSTDYLMGLTEQKNHPNSVLHELRLSDDMLDMLKKDILPTNQQFEKILAESVLQDKELSLFDDSSYEMKTLRKLKLLKKSIYDNVERLEEALKPRAHQSALTIAFHYHDQVIPIMALIRQDADELELITDRAYWPMPTYKELMFGVD